MADTQTTCQGKAVSHSKPLAATVRFEWSNWKLLFGVGEDGHVLSKHIAHCQPQQQSDGGAQAYSGALSDHTRWFQANQVLEWVVCEFCQGGQLFLVLWAAQ